MSLYLRSLWSDCTRCTQAGDMSGHMIRLCVRVANPLPKAHQTLQAETFSSPSAPARYSISSLPKLSELLPRWLHPDYRRPLVLQELLGYHADVICLQEVDETAFSRYFQPQLHAAGAASLRCCSESVFNKQLLRHPVQMIPLVADWCACLRVSWCRYKLNLSSWLPAISKEKN